MTLTYNEELLLKEMKDHAETLKKLQCAERRALIWKECAKKLKNDVGILETGMDCAEIFIKEWKARAEKAEAELAALGKDARTLGKDARTLAEYLEPNRGLGNLAVAGAIRRILERT